MVCRTSRADAISSPPHLDEERGFDKYLEVKHLNAKIFCRVCNEEVTVAEEGPKGASGVHIWLVLWKASRSVGAYAEGSISGLEICGSDFAVLEALLNKGPLPVNEIGRRVLLTSGSMTSAVDRLEAKGLVERRQSEDDRRSKIVHLTREGRSLISRAYAGHAKDLERLASDSLTAGERETLIRLLKKIGYRAASAAGRAEGQGRGDAAEAKKEVRRS
jgi:MarR family 2-MHQ and catechol resistance regulon transcriptional repressor